MSRNTLRKSINSSMSHKLIDNYIETLKNKEIMGKIDAVNKVIMFGFNYNHNFIEDCWNDDNHMAKHLKGKFLDTYDRVGANAVFSVFYSNLDKGNREKLITYILNK